MALYYWLPSVRVPATSQHLLMPSPASKATDKRNHGKVLQTVMQPLRYLLVTMTSAFHGCAVWGKEWSTKDLEEQT